MVSMQANARAKFDETIEIAINLGTNPKRGDQTVRGTAMLPHGTGKSLRIAAFAQGEDAIAATAAGETLCAKLLCSLLVASTRRLATKCVCSLASCCKTLQCMHASASFCTGANSLHTDTLHLSQHQMWSVGIGQC